MKNGVSWVVTPCGSCKNRRFGNWICFRLQAGGGAPTLQKNPKLAFPQAMPEQKKVNHWKQGDYKHLTAGLLDSSCGQVLIVPLFPVVDFLLFWHRLWKGKFLVFL
jgi:hypothetical protein